MLAAVRVITLVPDTFHFGDLKRGPSLIVTRTGLLISGEGAGRKFHTPSDRRVHIFHC